ncbi:MAG TPA: N-formylglutamate deformylase [Alcaligenes sp.]|nr:N-formylglutamate deformylase [Alcaligenes sp.]HRL26490.1 N-formylglutamate deformylase [Alcaligenes sp.]
MSTPAVFDFYPGTAPLLISMPHAGTYVPPDVAARFTATARQVPDTDWHLPRLYACARELGASVLVANYSRFVVDQNRPPDNTSLYPGQSVTGLCPLDTFGDEPIYLPGQEPQEQEVAQRRDAIWRPYHQQLEQELARLSAMHGRVVLWDAHSIRSVVPRFFQGTLPDLNFGTADGASCDPALSARLMAAAQADGHYTSVLNGRFKGGYITRNYGRPAHGVHAVQLEMAQCCYMQEHWPFDYQDEVARRVQPLIETLLREALAFAAQP